MERSPIATIGKPLRFFEFLLLESGSSELHKEFKSIAKDKEGYFLPMHPYNGLDDEYTYFIDYEKHDEMHTISYSFSSFLKERLFSEYSKTVYYIDRRIDETSDDREKHLFITQLLSTLNSFIEIADKQSLANSPLYLHTLNDLKSYLEKKFSTRTTSNDFHSGELNNTKDTFGFKKGINSISKLYHELVDIGFFDEDENQYRKFYNALTSFDKQEDNTLKVACSIQEAAYIFRELEPLFYNLSFKEIEQSGLFFNKKGKSITANDLSKALNTFKKQSHKKAHFIEKVENLVNNLS